MLFYVLFVPPRLKRLRCIAQAIRDARRLNVTDVENIPERLPGQLQVVTAKSCRNSGNSIA
jgi:hypothetical protein